MLARSSWHFSCSPARSRPDRRHTTASRHEGDRIDEHQKHRSYLNAHVRTGHGRTCAASRCSAEHPATAGASAASGDARRADHSHHWQVGNDGKPDNPNRADDCILSRVANDINPDNYGQRCRSDGASHWLLLDPEIRADHNRSSGCGRDNDCQPHGSIVGRGANDRHGGGNTCGAVWG